MEIEKVIEIMQEHINVCIANKTDINIEFMVNKGLLRKVDIADFKQHEEKQIEAYEIVVQACEKQAGKKVICETVDERGIEYEFIHYLCPNCRNIIHQQYKYAKVIVPYRQNYCVDCGQQINWGDEQQNLNRYIPQKWTST